MALHTSTTVGFGSNATIRRLVLDTDNDPSLLEERGVSYVRVFPSNASPAVTAVMGTALRVAVNLPLEVTDDYVSFSGSSSASLQYPTSGPVVIEDAKFYQVSPVVVWDADSNSLVLDQEAHGIVRVSYTAYYDRYVVTHGDAPCILAQEALAKGERVDDASHDPAFLVATAVGWETDSMEVSGPPCSDSGGYSKTKQYSDYEPMALLIEVDAAMQAGLYPYYFSASSVPGGFTLQPQYVKVGGEWIALYCGCRIRIYPKVGVTLNGVNCAVGTQIVGSGSKPIRQGITFSGTHSTSLEYPPVGDGSVAVLNTSVNALSIFGQMISVTFLRQGEWMNEVVWENANKYELTVGARKVREGEVVVATTAGRNTIPCYTFCEAQYTTEYYLYDMLFHWDEAINWYAPAMIIATDINGRVGHLTIEPPAKGGVL